MLFEASAILTVLIKGYWNIPELLFFFYTTFSLKIVNIIKAYILSI